MNKKLLVLVLAVVLVGGGLYIMNSSKSTQSTDLMVPALGTSGVEETIVTEVQTVQEITLDSFEFGFDQKEITVKKGQTVQITLTNSGKMLHDWVVDEITGAKTKQIKNGETDTITFVAETVGEFEYYCSVGQHRKNGMVGKIIVEE